MNDWRKIRRQAKYVDADLHVLYQEAFGADFSGSVTPSRARESIIEACKEMLTMGSKTTFDIEAAFERLNEKIDRILQSVNGRKEKPKDEVFIPITQIDGTKKLVQVASTVTIEKLREIATRYSTAFGMKDLLAIVGQHGGKKLSEVAEADYTLLASEMEARLARENGAKAVEVAPEITLDAIKPQAKAFFDKNGEKALAALLKTFGAKRLSEVTPDKYPALMEAFINA